jgi:hypothetical protein
MCGCRAVDDVTVESGGAAVLSRDEAIGVLAEAVQGWGVDVPEDPGVGELAELVAGVAARLRAGGPDEPMHGAAEALRAVSRLGALMPAVARWHLRNAVGEEAAARGCLAEAAAS